MADVTGRATAVQRTVGVGPPLSPSGGRDIPIGALIGGLVLLFVVLMLLHDVLQLIGLVVWIAAVAIAIRPIVGLYACFALAVLFEAESPDPLMAFGDFMNGGLTGTSGISGAIASPFELVILLTFFSWLFQGIARRDSKLRGGALGWPMLLFALAIVFGFIRGAAGGGDPYIGLFESRYLLYVPICYILAVNTIRTASQVRVLTSIALVGTGLFALEGAYRRLVLIDGHQLNVIQEFAYQHEDVIFLASAILVVLAVIAFGSRPGYRAVGVALLPFITFTLFASQRRAGFIALFVALAAFSLILLAANRKAFVLLAVPMLFATAVYMPLFWNDTGLIGQPARAVRSLVQPDTRDAASNTARLLEKINVVATIKGDPLLGVGFGRPYTFVVAGADLSWWPLWHFVTHANVLWLWMKMGFLGFVAFWVLIGAAVVRAVQVARTMADRETRVFAILALTVVVTVVVFAYVDIGFLSGRTMIFLGTILGGLGALGSMCEPAPASSAAAIIRRPRRFVAGVTVREAMFHEP